MKEERKEGRQKETREVMDSRRQVERKEDKEKKRMEKECKEDKKETRKEEREERRRKQRSNAKKKLHHITSFRQNVNTRKSSIICSF